MSRTSMHRRILIVEDDPELQELYACMLAGLPYDVALARDAEMALDLLRTVKPDLILLDLLLGDIGGDEFFWRIRRDPDYSAVPVLIVTVLADRACQGLLDLSPDTRFLRKPFSKATLLAALEACLLPAAPGPIQEDPSSARGGPV